MKTAGSDLRRRWPGGVGWLGSLALHGAVVAALLVLAPRAVRPPDRPLSMAIVKRPVPVPPPVKPAPQPRTEKVVARRAPTPQAAAPTPRPAPRKPIFGVSMSSVVTSGSTIGGAAFAVPVGESLMTRPDPERRPPTPAVAAAPRLIPSSRLTEMPRPKRLVKADYPEQARQAGIQGEVVLRLTIGPDGRVREVLLVKGIGHGLDELALVAARHFEFDPARVDGEPVATVIPFTYRWEIVN